MSKEKKTKKLKRGISTELERKVCQVCSDGYVKYKGKWYRGCCPIGKKPNCKFCDFAGCEVL